MCSGWFYGGLLAGGSPAATHFLLLRQEKVSKEKATRSLGPYASLRATCAARLRRGSAELAFGSNNCGPDPASICAARPSQDGVGKGRAIQIRGDKDAQRASLSEFGCWY